MKESAESAISSSPVEEGVPFLSHESLLDSPISQESRWKLYTIFSVILCFTSTLSFIAGFCISRPRNALGTYETVFRSDFGIYQLFNSSVQLLTLNQLYLSNQHSAKYDSVVRHTFMITAPVTSLKEIRMFHGRRMKHILDLRVKKSTMRGGIFGHRGGFQFQKRRLRPHGEISMLNTTMLQKEDIPQGVY